MSTNTEAPTTSTSSDLLPRDGESIYDAFGRYDFSSDQEFLNGLESIVSNAGPKTDAAREILVGEIKAFYFGRKTGFNVTWDGYLAWLGSKQEQAGQETPKIGATANKYVIVPPNASQAIEEPPPPSSTPDGSLSFAKISELIAQGKYDDIPFNRTIDEKLSTEKPSEPSLAVRKKPWET